jgi:hypothetical protein
MALARLSLCVAVIVGAAGLPAAAGKMYWGARGCAAEGCLSVIQRSDLDGTATSDVTQVRLAGITGIALDTTRGQVYWAEFGFFAGIMRGDENGCEAVATAAFPGNVEIDPARGKVYWEDFPERIDRVNLDGSGRETVFQAGEDGSLEGFALDTVEGKLYVTDHPGSGAPDRLSRMNLDGSGSEVISTGVGFGLVAVDPVAQKVYWIADYPRVLRRADLDGSNEEDVMPTDRVYALEIDPDGGKIYWYAGLAIQRANLDGSDQEDLTQVDFTAFVQLALDPADATGIAYIPCGDPAIPAIGRRGVLALCLLLIAASGLLHLRRIARG